MVLMKGKWSALGVVLFCVVTGLFFTNSCQGGTYIVSAYANIFGAGHPPPGDTPAPSGGGGGVPPVPITFSASPNNVFIFTNVIGEVCFGGPTRPNGPDGGNFPFRVLSYQGIAGINADCVAYLVGVFLDSAEPAEPAPTPLDFSAIGIGTNFVSLSPKIGQVFFIGDGLADNGVIQQFHAPPTATRLFLGFADSAHGDGAPGFYGDNSGWLSVTVERLNKEPWTNLLATWNASGPTVASASPVYTVSRANPLPRDGSFGYAVPHGMGLAGEIDASSDLIHWSPATNVALFFKDLDSTNDSTRFYRFVAH